MSFPDSTKQLDMPSHLVRVVMNETEPSRRRSDLLSPLPYAVILKSTARQPFPIRPMYTLSLLAVISLLASMLLSEAFIVCTKPSPEVIVRRRTHSILFMSTDALEKAASSSTVSSDTSSAESDTVIKSAGPCKNFPKCDGAYLNRGCGGTGKIQGGIATFPLLGWWPIKAYRPCPSATEAGYGYKRKGQDFSEFIAGERRKKPEGEELIDV